MNEKLKIADQDNNSGAVASYTAAIYQDELVTLYNDDCLTVIDSLTPVDCVIIDPPYSSGTRQATNRSASNIPKRGEKWNKSGIIWDTSFSSFGLSQFMNVFYRKVKNVMNEGAHIYTFIDWRQYPLLTMSIESAGLFINNLIVWSKGMYALGGNYRSQHELIVFASKGKARELTNHSTGNVMNFKRVSGGDHPTEKPVDLISKIIECATKEGQTVLDCFAGGGSSLLAAKNLGRRAVGIEIDKTYCELIKDRLNPMGKLGTVTAV